MNARRCVSGASVFGVSIHIGVGVIVYSYVQGTTRTSSRRISKDKVPRFVLFIGMVGAANPSKIHILWHNLSLSEAHKTREKP